MTLKLAADGVQILRITHDAFRRDADHLARAVDTGAAVDARRRAVLAGWTLFQGRLRRHHADQDAHLWPMLRGYLLARPDECALLDAMEREHGRIETSLASVDTAVHSGDQDWLAEAAAAFRTELLAHLRHEEEDVVPLLEAVFSDLDWRAHDAVRRKAAAHDEAELIPYLLAGADPETAAFVTARLSAATRWALKRRWQPRFATIARWG